MANIVYELPETYASITRPVAYEIIKQLRDNLGIINKDVRISFPGANGKLTVWNANNVSEMDAAQLLAEEKLIVDIKEEFNQDDMITMQSRRREHPPIFRDKSLGIYIQPVYSRTKVTINFTYHTNTRYQAENFRDYWRRKVAEGREYMVFNARYKYPIPEDIEKAFYILFHMRKQHLDDFETYQDYLFTLGSKHLTSLTNNAGQGDTLVMAEIQENIHGNFTDTDMPVEKEEYGNNWNVSFDFEYYYDKPISVMLNYPLMINNVMIPPVLYPEVHFDISKLDLRSGLTVDWYYRIQQDAGFQWVLDGAYIRIPAFDDWSNHIGWRDYQALLSAMLIVDKDYPKDICNMLEIDKYGIHPILQDSFKRNHMYLNIQGQYPFFVQLYRNNAYMDWDAITIDKDLNIMAKHDMSIYHTYHLVISVVKDIRMLSPEAQQRFFKDPTLVNAWLDIVLGHQPVNGYPKVHRARTPSNYYLDEKYQGHHLNGTNQNGDQDDTNDPNHPGNGHSRPGYNHGPNYDPNRTDPNRTGNYNGRDTGITKEDSRLQRYIGVVDIKDFDRVVRENKMAGKGRYFGAGCVFATVGIFTIPVHDKHTLGDDDHYHHYPHREPLNMSDSNLVNISKK